MKKLEQDLRTRGAIKWKHAMHLVRLLFAGITVMEEHVVPVAPFDIEDMAEALHRALTMNPEERRRRAAGMRRVVSRHPLSKWVDRGVSFARSLPPKR